MAEDKSQFTESVKNPYPELEQFALTDVVFTGVLLGSGSYGSVHEARVRVAGAFCAAKQIHEEFLRVGSLEEVEVVLKVFVAECTLLSNLRHPNIVQFFGICTLKDKRFPILLMEKLQGCLHSMLESKSNLSLVAKRSILLGVSRGIAYLHSQDPSIIHRDLSARNILLTPDMVPKIADLGMARFLELKKGSHAKTMTNAPGNIYMPPEALEPGCKYNTSIDVFSFGNLALFTLTRVFPELLSATYTHPKKDKVLGRSEIERRQKYFDMLNDMLGAKHSLVKLVTKCLQNKAKSRPTTPEIVAKLEEIKIDEEDRFWSMSKPELMEYISYREKEMERIADMLGKQQDMIVSQTEKIEMSQKKLETAEAQKQHLKALTLPRSMSLDVVAKPVPLDHYPVEAERVHFEIKGFKTSPLDPPCPVNPKLSAPESLESLTLSCLVEGADTEGDIRFPCSISWEVADRLPDMCNGLTDEAVTIGNSVYIRCGKNEIVKYTPHLNCWEKLPTPSLNNFKMVGIREQLVILEDNSIMLVQRNVILVWDDNSLEWMKPYPDFSQPRNNYSVATYNQYLLIIGGQVILAVAQTPIEILDTTNGVWYLSTTLPPRSIMYGSKTVVIGDTMVVGSFYSVPQLHSFKDCLNLPVPAIIEHATMKNKPKPTKFCKKMANLPHYNVTLLTIGQTLLAVGGISSLLLGTANKKVYMYNPTTDYWVEISKYPSSKSHSLSAGLALCAVLPSGKLFVVDRLRKAYIGTLT